MILRWRDIGFRGRIAILMVIPLILTFSVFGFYVTKKHIEENATNAMQRGELLVRHFSSIIELGMVAQDRTVLMSYADFMFKEIDVVSVRMSDINGNILAEKTRQGISADPSKVKYFSAPVLLSGVTVGGGENGVTDGITQQQAIGQVHVGILYENTEINENKILLVGLLSTILGIIISSIAGFKISRMITRPILRLNETVDLLTDGHLMVRVEQDSDGEIGALEKGVNNMAQALYESQADLQERVNRATKQLNSTVAELEKRNLELDRSRRQAEQLADEKAQFLARMSHELRTPLNAVIGFSRLLGKKISEQDRHEYAKTINDSATQLTSVIDDVLTLSKINSSSLSIHLERFNPMTVCEDVIVMLSTGARDKELELVLLVENNIPGFIDGDVVRIKQVVTNLVSNAIKFTDEGEVVVGVSCKNKPAGDFLEITVSDTGCGISNESIEKIFNEFSQLDNSPGRQAAGAGLGLFISRQLARLMAGDITANSEEGKGASFCFAIPMINPVFDDRVITPGRELAGKTALLYDETSASLQSLRNMLQRLGMNVQVTGAGGKVDDLQTGNNVTDTAEMLIISFSVRQLKTVDVGEIASELMARFKVPALLLTSIDMFELQDYAPGDEPCICTTKPIRLETLHNNIQGLLGNIDNSEYHLMDASGEYIGPWMAGMDVLVVEDNQFNQELIRIMLEERSARVTVVDNANDAISAVSNRCYSLILMDLHMPHFDGISAARILRNENGKCSQTPIIMVTADVLFDARQYIHDGLINQVLHKPIYENTLDMALASCIPDYGQSSQSMELQSSTQTGGQAKQKIAASLQIELNRLCDEILACLASGRIDAARENIHQLSGIAGYKRLNVISEDVADIQNLVNDLEIQSALLKARELKQSLMELKSEPL